MSEKIPMDLSTWDSGEATCVAVLRALCSTGSHFTDSMRLSTSWGRGVSLFLRVHVPTANVEKLRELIGKRGELKEPPQVQLNSAAPRPPSGTGGRA